MTTREELHEAVETSAALFAKAVEAADWPKASERAGWWFAFALIEAESARVQEESA